MTSFQNRKRKGIVRKKVWEKYAAGKHIASQVSADLHISPRSVHTYLNQVEKPKLPNATPGHVMIIMDCVYFKRVCVYFVVRDWYTKKNIYFKHIRYETIADYSDAVEYLEQCRCIIDGIIVDGRRGIFQALFPQYPIQMCQFHQKKIVRKYLTTNPQTKAGQSLWEITRQLSSCNRDWFELLLDIWYQQYEFFIKERTVNPETKRWFYTHKRVRSAYRSLRANLPYLFTCRSVKNMPNTTNSLDGFFAHLKDGVRIHRGLKLHRRTKLIEYLIVR